MTGLVVSGFQKAALRFELFPENTLQAEEIKLLPLKAGLNIFA